MNLPGGGVLHIISGLKTGGAELSLLRLLEARPELRAGASVISLRDRGTVGAPIEQLGVPVRTLELKGSIPTPLAVGRLVRTVREAPPSLIQGWMYHGNLAALLAARALPNRPPVIWNIRHSVYRLASEKPFTALVIRLGAALSGRAVRIVYNSRVAAKQHEALGYLGSRTVVIPNGFDVQRFRPSADARLGVRTELGVSQDTPLVGLVGRYHAMKDHTNFLQAAAKLVPAYPAARFVMAGPAVDPDNGELLSQVRELGLENVVQMIGELRDTARFMAALDVLCLSSSSEGFPNVVGEAMACGVPCAATDVGDAAWLVDDTGVVVPARDPEALAGALGTLLGLPNAARRDLGLRARRRIEGQFGLAASAQRYHDLYLDVMNGLPPR